MKIYTIIGEILVFLLVTAFCVVPPLFTFLTPDTAQTFTQWTFPFSQMSLFIFAVVVYIICKPVLCGKQIQSENSKIVFLLKYVFTFVFCFCMLFGISLLIKGVSYLLKDAVFESSVKVTKPDTFVSWILCLLTFAFSAFYEECIYRFYFPETLLHLFHFKWNNKVLNIILEIIACAVFAFGHLYLGYLSVINAAFAHILLRFFFVKNKTIVPLFAAHFCYNIISLILL